MVHAPLPGCGRLPRPGTEKMLDKSLVEIRQPAAQALAKGLGLPAGPMFREPEDEFFVPSTGAMQ